jgi:ribonuclease P protein component
VFSIRNGLEYSRFGLTISRKLGKANRRNRTKRRIKEVLRISRDTLPMGFDFVLNPRRSAANQHFEDLSKELISLFGAEK